MRKTIDSVTKLANAIVNGMDMDALWDCAVETIENNLLEMNHTEFNEEWKFYFDETT